MRFRNKIFQHTRQSCPTREVYALRQKRPVLRARQREDAPPRVNKRSPRQLAIANPAAPHRQKISSSANPQSSAIKSAHMRLFFIIYLPPFSVTFPGFAKPHTKASQSFRARRREIKMEIMLSGGSADRKHTLRLASVEFCASGAKNYARSRGASPLPEKASAFFR